MKTYCFWKILYIKIKSDKFRLFLDLNKNVLSIDLHKTYKQKFNRTIDLFTKNLTVLYLSN